MDWLNFIPCAQVSPGYGSGGWWGPGMMPFGGMGMIIVLIFAAFLIIVLLRVLRNLPAPSRYNEASAEDSPMDILKKRFARGEINEEEFNKMKKKIEDH
ncbi:MAG: SHOCT domain-containing protein [Thermodesulfobacteriota bacterium]